MAKKRTAAKSNGTTSDQLGDWLKANDIPFFLKREKMSTARKSFNASTTKVSASKFREAVNENCRYWKTSHRLRFRKPVTLNVDGWTKLKQGVSSILEDLRGVRLRHAVDLVRTRVSVNAKLLDGLPKRLHVWKGA